MSYDDRAEGGRFHDALQLACPLLPRVHGRRPGGRLGTTGNLEAAEREITHAMLR